jgi:galactosylceramidase
MMWLLPASSVQLLALLALCALPDASATTSSSFPVSDAPGLGRRFDGLGALSGGGATSVFLRSYPEPQRSEILDYLFLPRFGASLQILKVEIGGDAQSTQGVESSHMHAADDLNLQRGYEWWLMKEARARNPDIALYGLAWAFPGWVGNGSGDPFAAAGLTAHYLTAWVDGAATAHGLDISYLGLWNEKPTDTPSGVTFVPVLRAALDAAGHASTTLVASDMDWSIAPFLLNTTELRGAFGAIGAHYPSYTATPDAQATGLPLWASEDYSNFNGGTGNDNGNGDGSNGGNWGAACWARTVNRNYVNGNITAAVMWHMASAIDDHMWWYGASALNAPQPWSGHYQVTPTLWSFAHTTQFTSPGWHYLRNGSGCGWLAAGGSYVALTGPQERDDASQLTLVVEKMRFADSQCMHNPAVPDDPASFADENVTFLLGGSFSNVTALHVWRTHYGHSDDDPTVVFVYGGIVPVAAGTGEVAVEVRTNDLVTLSTIATARKGCVSSAR